MTQSPPTGELVARLRAMNPWKDMDWPEVVKAAADRLEASATLERDLEDARKLNNKYAWERDKAREERDAAGRRSEAFWGHSGAMNSLEQRPQPQASPNPPYKPSQE